MRRLSRTELYPVNQGNLLNPNYYQQDTLEIKNRNTSRRASSSRMSIQVARDQECYFDNDIQKTVCQGCGNQTISTTSDIVGCTAISWCLLLAPLGMGTCFIPFFIKKCLDVEQRCIRCNHTKRKRKAPCC